MRFLIIDKRKRIGDLSQLAYVIQRLVDEVIKVGAEYSVAYHDQISLSNFNGQLQILANGEDIKNFTHVFLRGHRTKEEYEMKKYIVEYCDKHNIKVQNKDFMKKFFIYNKLIQLNLFSELDLPYLPTYYRADGDYINDNFVKNTEFPLIVKSVEGVYEIENEGGVDKLKKPIYLANSYKDLVELSKELELKEYFLQKFVKSGFDYRIVMLNGKYLSGFKRASKSSFITVRDGEYSTLDKKEEELLVGLSKKAVDLLNIEFCALDIITEDGKPYILEINMNPGFKAIENKVPGLNINIAEAMVKGMIE